jgi:hypothetical protein
MDYILQIFNEGVTGSEIWCSGLDERMRKLSTKLGFITSSSALGNDISVKNMIITSIMSITERASHSLACTENQGDDELVK